MRAKKRNFKAAVALLVGSLLWLHVYPQDGTLDLSFDADGKSTTNIAGDDDIYGLAIQNDGKILVAGSSNAGTDDAFTVARFKYGLFRNRFVN